jgi:hypothetical protein
MYGFVLLRNQIQSKVILFVKLQFTHLHDDAADSQYGKEFCCSVCKLWPPTIWSGWRRVVSSGAVQLHRRTKQRMALILNSVPTREADGLFRCLFPSVGFLFSHGGFDACCALLLTACLPACPSLPYPVEYAIPSRGTVVKRVSSFVDDYRFPSSAWSSFNCKLNQNVVRAYRPYGFACT